MPFNQSLAFTTSAFTVVLYPLYYDYYQKITGPHIKKIWS